MAPDIALRLTRRSRSDPSPGAKGNSVAFRKTVQPICWVTHDLGVRGKDSEIYDSLRWDLIRYATALVGPDAASDLLSSVMVRLLAKRRLSDLADPGPYLFKSVLNEARALHRRGRWRSTAVDFGAVTYDYPNLQPEVLAAVMQLPLRQRAATFLVYWEDCSMREAARAMGVSEGTVKRYLALARRRLKGKLYAQL